jgi:plasmid stabilization system protein ParE
MNYRFLSPALVELREAAVFYEERVNGLGSDFLDEVDHTVQRILCFPEAWGKIGIDYRRCSLRRFPYLIIYTIVPDGSILIISVFHQSRNPDSWRDQRLQ